MTLLTRLFLLVLIAVAPTVAIQLSSLSDLHDQREREAAHRAERLLRVMEGEQNRLFDGMRRMMEAVSIAELLPASEHDRCQAFLDRLARRAPGHMALAVHARDGRIVCGGAPGTLGAIATSGVIDQALFRGGFALGAWARWPGIAEPVLPMALPIEGDDGRPAGAVSLVISLPWLALNLGANALPEGASFVAADHTGTALVRLPASEGDMGEVLLPDVYRPLLRAAEGGAAELPWIDGARRVVAYAPLPVSGDGLFLAVGFDGRAIFADAWRATSEGLLVTALGVAAAMLAAWIGGLVFVRRPVRALMRAASDWSAGRSNARVGLTDTKSEIGRLGRAFDGMAETLEAREQALRRSERHLRAVLDTLPSFVSVLTPDGVIQAVNRAALETAGVAETDLVGRRFDAIGHWGENPHLRARVRGAIATAALGKPMRFDVPQRMADGQTRLLDLTLAAMLDGEGQVTHLIASGLDVTERKRTEDALRLTEGRFRTALRNSRVVVFNQDRALRYTWVHDPVWGVRPEAIAGRTDREAFADHPDIAERLTRLKRRVIDSGESAREEIRLICDGEEHCFDLTVEPQRDRDGDVVGIICASIDVTERRRDEDAVRSAREEADRANLAKTKFLAAASHDLRQPVQSLFLFTAALRDRLAGHEAQPLVDNLNQTLDTLKQLLDGLLDMSRMDSGRIAPTVEAVRLSHMLGRLAVEYGPRASAGGLGLKVRPCSAWVRTDPAMLERILRNLIENALRYTKTGRILVGARVRGATVRLEVWDTGVGIPADRLDDIFQEFTQIADHSHSRSGLGLGLAIVKRLSRLLGHRVTVRSTAGKGSVFMVELPRVVSSQPVQAVQARLRVVANNERQKGLIVIVDDEPIILLGLKAMLEGWGYDVVAARSGSQAVERLRRDQRRPVMVLSDYQLQDGETGPKVLAAIADVTGGGVPEVILTGDTTPERLAEAQAAGFRVLHKPVFPSDLRKVMALAGAA